MIIESQLKQLVPKTKVKYLVNLNQTLTRFNIITPLQTAHFLAQILHESCNFVYFEEIASGAAYEGRLDLGNVYPGDGVKYKGRGVIQITGRANYKAISTDLNIDFVNDPTKLTTEEFAFLSGGWFWNKHKLNILADQDNIFKVSKTINGINRKTGLPNGYESRKALLAKCKQVLAINA